MTKKHPSRYVRYASRRYYLLRLSTLDIHHHERENLRFSAKLRDIGIAKILVDNPSRPSQRHSEHATMLFVNCVRVREMKKKKKKLHSIELVGRIQSPPAISKSFPYLHDGERNAHPKDTARTHSTPYFTTSLRNVGCLRTVRKNYVFKPFQSPVLRDLPQMKRDSLCLVDGKSYHGRKGIGGKHIEAPSDHAEDIMGFYVRCEGTRV